MWWVGLWEVHLYLKKLGCVGETDLFCLGSRLGNCLAESSLAFACHAARHESVELQPEAEEFCMKASRRYRKGDSALALPRVISVTKSGRKAFSPHLFEPWRFTALKIFGWGHLRSGKIALDGVKQTRKSLLKTIIKWVRGWTQPHWVWESVWALGWTSGKVTRGHQWGGWSMWLVHLCLPVGTHLSQAHSLS